LEVPPEQVSDLHLEFFSHDVVLVFRRVGCLIFLINITLKSGQWSFMQVTEGPERATTGPDFTQPAHQLSGYAACSVEL
jgi:hypothetical protein